MRPLLCSTALFTALMATPASAHDAPGDHAAMSAFDAVTHFVGKHWGVGLTAVAGLALVGLLRRRRA